MRSEKRKELDKIFSGNYKAPENWSDDPDHFEDDIFEKWLDNFEEGLHLCEETHEALVDYLCFCRVELKDIINCVDPEWAEQLYWVIKHSIVDASTKPSKTLWGLNRLRAFMDADTPFERGMYLQSIQYNF